MPPEGRGMDTILGGLLYPAQGTGCANGGSATEPH